MSSAGIFIQHNTHSIITVSKILLIDPQVFMTTTGYIYKLQRKLSKQHQVISFFPAPQNWLKINYFVTNTIDSHYLKLNTDNSNSCISQTKYM